MHRMRVFFFIKYLVFLFILQSCYSAGLAKPSTDSTKNQDIPETLTLDQAIDYALQNNTDVQSQKQAIQVSKAEYIQARSAIFPQLNLGAEGERLDNVSASTTSGAKVDELFSTISLSQELFTFGKLGYAIKYEKIAIQIEETQLEDTTQGITLSVTSVFYDVLLQQELVRVSVEALQDAEDHLKESKLRFNQGVSTQFDVTQAEVNVANQKPALIAARNNLIQARQNLNEYLNLPPNTNIDIIGKLDFVEYLPDSDKDWQIARDNRPDLKIQKLTVQQNEAELSLKHALYFPTIAANGDYTLQSNRYDGTSPYDFTSWSANITLTMPIFDGFNISGQIKQVKAELKQAELANEKALLAAQTQVEQAILQIREQKELVDAAKEASDLATLSLKLARLSYENGRATTLDVTDAELSLTTAESNLAKAKHDYSIALASLKNAMGVNTLPS
jgi:TolC family type I secretion outer membrane protein